MLLFAQASMLSTRTITALGALAGLTFMTGAAHADSTVEACSDAYSKGQEERLAGRLFSARTQFRLCSESACPNAFVEDCRRWSSEVEADLPTIRLKVTGPNGAAPEGMTAWMDGVSIPSEQLGQAIVADAGPHEFRFEAPGYEPAKVENSLTPEDRDLPVVVALFPKAASPEPSPIKVAPVVPAAPAARPFPVAAATFAGIGVLALGGSAYFGLSAKHRYDDLKSSCGHFCAESAADSVRSKALVSDIALATSVVAFGAAAWFYFRTPAQDSASAALGVEPRADGARMRLRVVF